MPGGRIDASGRRILVIDDDLAIRVLLQAVLKRLKFEVELAEDGQAGLEKLRSKDGYDYEFIDRIKGILPDRRPHIIVFTAAGKRGVDKIPPDSVCNTILKPFDLE